MSFSFTTPATASGKKQGKSKSSTSVKNKGKSSKQSAVEASPSPLTQGIDSIFLNAKADLDQIIQSPLLRGKSMPLINSFFFKMLKEHQPYYSLTRVNQNGDVVNEVIRLVEKEDIKKQNFAKEPWFKIAGKKHQEYFGMIKLEETGRYYLFWAVPVTDSLAKGKVSFEGVVVLKIDLWDSFHKYANSIETPFLVRIDRLHLYSNKWKDTIDYKEGLLTIPGIKKAFVRYPLTMTALVVASAPPAAVVTVPTVDSTQIKAIQDSLKKATALQLKKKNMTRNIIIAVLVGLIVIGALLIFVVVPMLKQRAIMADIDRDEA
jgi:hypothetical protein